MWCIQSSKVRKCFHADRKKNEKFKANLKESGITVSTISTSKVQDILLKDILSSLNDEVKYILY